MRFCAAFRDLIGPLSQTIKMTLSFGSSPVPPYGPITALGVLFEWLVGLRTDGPPCFAFGSFFFTPPDAPSDEVMLAR